MKRIKVPKIVAAGKVVLDRLTRDGYIKVDESTREYVGLASDGNEVCLGWIGGEDTLCVYLVSHPSPSDW